jgi:phosphoadenosine phosphosulfate reductase
MTPASELRSSAIGSQTPAQRLALAERAGVELESASAGEIARWAATTFGDQLCVTSSMADAVVVHLMSTVAPGVDVVFLDTGYHFPETLGTRDAVAASYPVNMVTISPATSVGQQDALLGSELFGRDPDRCCELRKVVPLNRALAGYQAWVSGVRRDEAIGRGGTPVVGWDSRRAMVKVNPIARWTDREVTNYARRNGVIINPLRSAGFASIGCAPCTRPVMSGESARAGRWKGAAKTECGIHG